VDGIILITPTTSIPDPYLHIHREVPLVFVDIEITGNPMCAVTVDHNRGGYLSTRHLLELGHRHIAFLTGPLSLSSSIRCVEGYKQAMTEAGIPIEDQLVVMTKKTGIEDGFAGMLDILKIVPKPTAVATFSDLLAAGVLEAARQYGLAVPDDLSIVGYDDIPLISLLSPPLTTIKQNKDELGKIAVELLFSEILEAGHEHQQIRISPSLIIRGSTAPPPLDCIRGNKK
jgi:LacI family transcriptional regulator